MPAERCSRLPCTPTSRDRRRFATSPSVRDCHSRTSSRSCDPAELQLSEIVSAVDGPISVGDFGEPHRDGACDHEGQCVLIAVWNEASEFMRKHLASYTLAEVAKMARGQAPWPEADA
jgi:hypothetical protein